MTKGLHMPFRSNTLRPYLIKQGVFLSLVAGLFTVSMQLCIAEPSILQPLPLVTKNNFKYVGAFRVPKSLYGDSRAGSTQGPITIGPDGSTFFIASHPNDDAVAEFSIPALSSSMNIDDLNMASNIQPFARLLDRPDTGNPQGMNTIGGMEYVNGELIVNAFKYYDANALATHTTLVVGDATDLQGSSVAGYHGYEARAHAAGWISPVPISYQDILGGTHIAGHSSGTPINGRHSLGPSAFAINPGQDVIGDRVTSTIPTSTLLDFSLTNIIGDSENKGASYLGNEDLSNDLWTYLSQAVYGFIVPGTRSYMTIGYSGGHAGGAGYKALKSDGSKCGGYCAYDENDNSNYYWLWDLNDLVAVKNGQKNPHEIMPYAYGIFDTPFQTLLGSELHRIIGGAYDNVTNRLYLTLKEADTEQGQYHPAPLILAYELPALPSAPSNLRLIQ